MFGSFSGPFFIYTLRPHARVPCDVNIGDVGEPPQVLFVEESDDGVDLLSSGKVQNNTVVLCVLYLVFFHRTLVLHHLMYIYVYLHVYM